MRSLRPRSLIFVASVVCVGRLSVVGWGRAPLPDFRARAWLWWNGGEGLPLPDFCGLGCDMVMNSLAPLRPRALILISGSELLTPHFFPL